MPPRPRSLVRKLDAIADGIIPTLNTVLRLMGSTPERPDPVRRYYALYIVLLVAFLIEFLRYLYRH
jgi:hypothetical protein